MGVNGPILTRLVWPLTVDTDTIGGILVLSIAGRLGSAATDQIVDVLGRCRPGDRVILDLAQVDYVGSQALVAIRAAGERLATAEGGLVVCHLALPVRLCFDLAGVSPYLAIEDTREQGIARLLQRPART